LNQLRFRNIKMFLANSRRKSLKVVANRPIFPKYPKSSKDQEPKPHLGH